MTRLDSNGALWEQRMAQAAKNGTPEHLTTLTTYQAQEA